MFEIIEKLQKKPESVRKRIVIMTSGLITLLILIVWLSTLGSRSLSAGKDNIASPLSSVGRGISQVIDKVKGNFDKLGTFTTEPNGNKEEKSDVIIEWN